MQGLKPLVADVAETTAGTARGLRVRAGEVALATSEVHFIEQGEEFAFELGRVINLKRAVGILDETVRGTATICALYQETVRGELVNVGVVGGRRCASGFDLDGD